MLKKSLRNSAIVFCNILGTCVEPPASPNKCVLAKVCYRHFGEQKGFSGIYSVCHRKFRSDPRYWLFLSRSSKPLKSHELRKEILTVLVWSLLEKSFPSASICSAYLPCSIFGEVVAWLLGRGRDKKKILQRKLLG